jgi:hypothetical protein
LGRGPPPCPGLEMIFFAAVFVACAIYIYKKDLSWNIEGLELPEFKDEYICYAMHKFFADGCYSLEDAMLMKLEDFYVHTEIYI